MDTVFIAEIFRRPKIQDLIGDAAIMSHDMPKRTSPSEFTFEMILLATFLCHLLLKFKILVNIFIKNSQQQFKKYKFSYKVYTIGDRLYHMN